jgi:hypothetical protein
MQASVSHFLGTVGCCRYEATSLRLSAAGVGKRTGTPNVAYQRLHRRTLFDPKRSVCYSYTPSLAFERDERYSDTAPPCTGTGAPKGGEGREKKGKRKKNGGPY